MFFWTLTCLICNKRKIDCFSYFLWFMFFVICIWIITWQNIYLLMESLSWKQPHASISGFSPETVRNTWVHTQQCGYWCPGAKAPGHQYPKCWPNIHYIVFCVWDNPMNLLRTARTDHTKINHNKIIHLFYGIYCLRCHTILIVAFLLDTQ